LAQALALKKAGNMASAKNKLKQIKRLEQTIDLIESQKDNIQTIKMSAYCDCVALRATTSADTPRPDQHRSGVGSAGWR
jgi:hypothetical protein